MKLKKILIIILATPFLAVAGLATIISIIFLVVDFFAFGHTPFYHYEDYIISNKKETLVKCGSLGGEIKKATYGGGGGDQVSKLIYYEKNNKKILISHIIDIYGMNLSAGSENIEKNWDFFKNMDLESAEIGNFSILNFMQKDKYDVINQESYDHAKQTLSRRIKAMKIKARKYDLELYPGPERNYQYDSIFDYSPYHEGQNYFSFRGSWIPNSSLSSAVYLDPTKISQREYSTIVNCLKNAKEKNFLPSILIYKKYLKDDKFYSFQNLPCKDSDYSIIIDLDGKTAFRTSYQDDDFYIGYFDFDGKFVRDIEPYKRYRWIKKDFKSPNLQEAGFTTAYQESQSLKLLFNSKGEPINDYLKTCKNSEGKNIFDIFKH